ncbi:MAG: hypothetical protein ABI480_18330 [Chitinophagaceae bacterium]
MNKTSLMISSIKVKAAHFLKIMQMITSPLRDLPRLDFNMEKAEMNYLC